MIVDTFDGWKVMDSGLLRRKRLEYNEDGSPLTQENLGKMFHKPISISTICRWEMGDTAPPLARFKELCLILQVDPKEFLGIAELIEPEDTLVAVVEPNPETGPDESPITIKVLRRGGPKQET